MALIRCSECGKEISDKAAACVNCGCPVSAMKKEPIKSAEQPKSAQTGKTTVTKTAIDSILKDIFNDGTNPVPKEMPEPGFFAGMLLWAVGKLCGLCGVAGVGTAGMLLVDLLKGDGLNTKMLLPAVAALAAAWFLGWLLTVIKFSAARRFIRKNGYESSIRYDGSAMTNSLNAFGLYPCKAMAKYIGRLNPKSGSILEQAIKNAKAKKKKEWLSYLPYLAVLAAVYYLLPNYGWIVYLYDECLIIAHVVTFIVMTVYGYKKSLSWGAIVATAAIFAPTVLAYYGDDLWYHILICAAVAFAGMYAGLNLYLKKK